MSRFNHLCMYKNSMITTSGQLFGYMKAISQTFCTLQEEMEFHSIMSIINAFTTFLLLSFSKILFVSFTLLYSFKIKYNFEISREKYVLYYDPTVEYNTQEHSVCAAIAICVLAIFIIFPTIILILYPTRLFRRCVSCCGFRRWHALHMFVESFQGQYKDGTNGTWDFRMISALFLILRILTMATFANRYYSYYASSGVQCLFFASTMQL